MSENGEIYTAGKNFTLPPAVTAWTNSTSAQIGLTLRWLGQKPNFRVWLPYCYYLVQESLWKYVGRCEISLILLSSNCWECFEYFKLFQKV